MTTQQLLRAALPLRENFRLRCFPGEDDTITIERLAPVNTPFPLWEEVLRTRFKTCFDLNYALRNLGGALLFPGYDDDDLFGVLDG